MKTHLNTQHNPKFLLIFLTVFFQQTWLAYAQSPVITPKQNLVFPLDATGNITIVPGDVASVSNAGNATVAVSPAAFNCTQLGNQMVTVTVTTPSEVEFSDPVGIVTDPSDNIFFTDATNHLIKKITPDGTVSTFAGSGADGNANGSAATASFGDPAWMAIDHLGNLFVVDYEFNEIRKITPNGVVSNFGSGFQQTIQGIVSDRSNDIFAAVGTYIDKITPDGTVSLFAGINEGGNQDGQGMNARFSFVRGIIIDPSNNLFVLDYGNTEIRKITPDALVSTIYRFTQYEVNGWLTINTVGDLFMTQQFSVWELSASGVASNFVGMEFMGQGFKDGTGSNAEFNELGEITTDGSGNMYVTDQNNNAIRKITPSGTVTTLTGGVAGNQNGNIYHGSTTSKQIPVSIVSAPVIAAHADETIPPGPNCTALIPDYTIAAGVSNVCSQVQLKVKQSPTAGTVVILNSKTPITLTVTDGFGGMASTSFSVTSIDKPVINPKPGAIILPLDASGNYSVQLSDVAKVSGCSAPIDVKLSPSTFSCADVGMQLVSVTATYPFTGVSTTLQVPVNVTSSLAITSKFNDTTLQGDGLCPLQLPDYTGLAKATDNCFNVTFIQIPSPGTIVTGSGPMRVTITATDSNQNTVKISFNVTPSVAPPPVPAVTIEPAAPVICAGNPLTFIALPMNFGSGLSYHWQVNGKAAGGNSASFTATGLNDGDHVTCTVTGSLSCITPLESQPVTVKVNPLPTITLPKQLLVNAGQSIQLLPVVSGNVSSYQWSPATGLSNTTIPDPVASPAKTMTYQLLVTAASGCLDSTQVTVTVLKPILINNTFTPNGDGINDTWNINYLSNYAQCTVDVFTRYGQQIFHSIGYPVPWDGTYGGKNLPSGTYYYVIDLKNDTKKLAGFVAIIR